MEASFCGPTKGLHKDTHFSQKLLVVSFLCSKKLRCRNQDGSLVDPCINSWMWSIIRVDTNLSMGNYRAKFDINLNL